MIVSHFHKPVRKPRRNQYKRGDIIDHPTNGQGVVSESTNDAIMVNWFDPYRSIQLGSTKILVEDHVYLAKVSNSGMRFNLVEEDKPALSDTMSKNVDQTKPTSTSPLSTIDGVSNPEGYEWKPEIGDGTDEELLDLKIKDIGNKSNSGKKTSTEPNDKKKNFKSKSSSGETAETTDSSDKDDSDKDDSDASSTEFSFKQKKNKDTENESDSK